jgi:hypothetical protein
MLQEHTFAPPTLWHVTCDHYHENGCYGSESSNNENATRDSGPRRNHSSAATASKAWLIPDPTTLARNPCHWSSAETDHRCRYARPTRYPPPSKDYSFAASSGICGFTHDRDRYRSSRSVTRPRFVASSSVLGHQSDCQTFEAYGLELPSLIEDILQLRLAKF